MVLLSEVVQTFILADFWCVANLILNTIHLEIFLRQAQSLFGFGTAVLLCSWVDHK